MRLLMVEDDGQLCRYLRIRLEKTGYTVDVAEDGLDALYYLENQVYDLVVLDRMLPGLDGIGVLRHMRGHDITTPVILVTAMSGIHDRVDGLDAGADDYLVKPFAPEELYARIRALTRRPRALEEQELLAYQDIQLDVLKKLLLCKGKSLELSKKETDLLECFMRNPGQILTREVLLARVWGPDSFVEEGNLDNFIYFVRRRLKNIGSRVILKNIRSVGYCLKEEQEKGS